MSSNTEKNWKLENYEERVLQGTRVFFPPPSPIPNEPFVGRQKFINDALATWSTLDGSAPQHFRLYGPPGTGKNALIYELARILEKEIYVINGNDELDAEDIACTPTMKDNEIVYIASELAAAMLRGGICFFDEIAKAPEGSLALLAPALGMERTLKSKKAAITIPASSGFLFCAALNENEEAGKALPDYIDKRTRPAYHVGMPSLGELEIILKSHINGDADLWIQCFISLFRDSDLAPRDAIALINNARKHHEYEKTKEGNKRLSQKAVNSYLREAAKGFPGVTVASPSLPPVSKEKKEERRDMSNVLYKVLPGDGKKTSIH